jgi:hypothetical protein
VKKTAPGAKALIFRAISNPDLKVGVAKTQKGQLAIAMTLVNNILISIIKSKPWIV